MSIVFNADEVFGMAERIEANGKDFYQAAAAKVDEPANRLLLDLAVWENKHLDLFRTMRQELNEDDRGEVPFDPDDEASLYVQAMADSVVFKPGEDALSELGDEPSMQVIIEAALKREKEAIAFFSGVRELVPGRLGKDRIDAIIREEMTHVSILTKQMAALGL